MARILVVLLTLAVASRAQGEGSATSLVIISDPSGTTNLVSENYPDNYPSDHVQSWIVVSPGGEKLQFDSNDFWLQSKDIMKGCEDFLEIHELGQSVGGKFCGMRGPQGLRSKENAVTVVFKSNSAVEYKGFNITVRSIAPPYRPPNITVLAVPQNGAVTFRSTNYPANYPSSHNETFIITGPEGSALQFDAIDFDVENNCALDYLDIQENGKSLGKFCGQKGPKGFLSYGNQVKAVFRTDGRLERRGFNISVKVAKCPRDAEPCPNHPDVCVSRDGYCNGVRDCPDGSDELCPASNGSCGVSTIPPALTWESQRIIGGIDVIPNSWPWQIGFMDSRNELICGGSILNDRWIMTAGHCCEGRDAKDVKAKLAAHNLKSRIDTGYDVEIEKLVIHPKYTSWIHQNRPTHDLDYCLLRTKEPIVFNRRVSPVCLPTPADSALETLGTSCYITGWGRTSPFESIYARTLQQTRVQISSKTQCNAAYDGVVTDNMICAAEPGRDRCEGDDGGPLMCRDNEGKFKLVGVTSWGRNVCGMSDFPGVYARTSSDMKWIEETIASN